MSDGLVAVAVCLVMRPRFVTLYAIVAGLVFLAGWSVYRADFGGGSPFALGVVKAGVPFDEMEEQATRELKHGFTCEQLGAVRLCRITTDGPPGEMRVVVADDRAALVELASLDTSPKMRQESRQMGADWSLVATARPGPSDLLTSATRWVSRDDRWSAELWRRDEKAYAMRVRLADERWVREIAGDPATVLHLARRGIVDDVVLGSAERRDTAAFARAIEAQSPGAAAHAARVATLPECERLPTIAVPATDSTHLHAFGASSLAAAEGLARLAFGGSTLVAGDRRFYLVDSAGFTEEVTLGPYARSGDYHAFAVSFPQRLTRARDRAESRIEDMQCRALTELFVVRVDPLTRTAAAVRRLPVQAEALASRVTGLEFIAETDDAIALAVQDVATYGTAEWDGQLQWTSVVTADSGDDGALKLRARVPEEFVMRSGEHERSGALIVPEAASPARAVRIDALGAEDRYARTRRLVVVPGPDGLVSGWTLLPLL